MSRDNAATPPESQHTLLRVYGYYRFILALLMVAMFWLEAFPSILGTQDALLFSYTASIYLGLSLLTLIRLHIRRFAPSEQFIFLVCFIDVVSITLLAQASGGIGSGLGLLMLVTISAASITLTGQLATLIAALATLGVLTSTIYNLIFIKTDFNDLLPAGLLGFLLFVTSQLFLYLTKRARLATSNAELQTLHREQIQHLNQLIVQRMRTGIVVLKPDGEVRLINESAAKLLDLPGKPNLEDLADFSFAQIPLLFEALQHWRDRRLARHRPIKLREAGPELQLSFAGLEKTPTSDIIVFVEDTRELAQQAQQLKLASLGHLTANIAHEIRNPLGAISHAAQLLQESPTLEKHDKRLSEIIQHHSRRVNRIIENVLQLSRRQKPVPTRIHLEGFLAQFIHNYQQTHAGEISIQTKILDPHLFITVDSSQFEQVLSNLCDNGLRYSRAATGKATLLLCAYNDPVLETPCLDIIDDGSGIAPENQSKIFEPFFTTETHGTGLGLYLAREICESNQARLDYKVTPEGKSCFQISFAHPDKIMATSEAG